MNNPYQPPSMDADAPTPTPDGVKSRHGCLTALLILMLIANSGVMFMHLTMSEQIMQATPGLPVWSIPVLALVAAFNVACAIALFKWKRWGFYGFIGSSVVAGSINVMAGLSPGQIAGGLVGALILYGVLQIGEPSGWSQME